MSTHEDKAASDREIPGESPLQIVGVGASAGGLEALEAFVGALVPSPDTAFVIAQHLSPSHFIAKPMPLNEVIAWLDERRLRA